MRRNKEASIVKCNYRELFKDKEIKIEDKNIKEIIEDASKKAKEHNMKLEKGEKKVNEREL